MYLLLVSLIVISTAGGATFAVLREDISTGLSIATYILTCLSLMLALAAAGQWFGLSKPDSFSFAYDMDINQILGVKEEK
jgi:Mg2+/Co2+ transporter CorB